MFLGKSLPESMLPSDVVLLPTIPLTPHGEVDRGRLPAPTASEELPDQLAALSPTEAILTTFWADLLGRNGVGAQDDFFNLGGHSLLLASLQQRIATEFGQTIPLAELIRTLPPLLMPFLYRAC